jgi:glycerophosphoryl diester phosphodiesterase
MALIIGHRGSKALAPENSLESIHAAAMCRADCIEVDVRLSKDGALILMHDETVDRTTNGRGRVEDLALAELQALEMKGGRIPTLGEAAALARDLGLGIIVEMKEEGIEELVIEELKGTNALVTSFYHSSLREIKEISEIRTGIIISSLPVYPVELANWAGADAIFPKRFNPRLFQEAHRSDIAVYPWTVNSIDEAKWLLRLGADGLVTDDPCLLRDIADRPPRDTSQGNCDYYPCHHFEDQDCTHCFCPLYPCRDESLGRFVKTKRGKRVWTCIDCRLVHRPDVARYLLLHPDASVLDLKVLARRGEPV